MALRKLDIVLIEDKADQVDAMLVHIPPSRPVIPVNSAARLLCRRRFSIARETHKYSLRGLAHRYMVAVQAMEIRLKELGLACRVRR